jgi:hypothetical protein
MSRLNPRVVSRLAVLATALLVSQLVLAVVQAAEAPDTAPLHTLAQPEARPTPPPEQRESTATSPNAPTLSCAGGVARQTWVFTQATARSTNAAFPTVLDTVSVPPAPGTAGQLERVLVTFSAESACSGGTPWCSVRILIAGVEASPASGVDFAFDSTDSNKEGSGSWESHSMQRCRFLTLPSTGNYTVEVDWGASSAGGGTTFRLDDYTITVAQFD